jgi:hypothetical protein
MEAALPGTLRSDVPPEGVRTVGHMRVQKTNFYYIYGLLGAPPEQFFSDEISQQTKTANADGIANISYSAEYSFLDMLLSCLTCSIVTPRTYVFEADLVRIQAPPAGAASARQAPPPPPSAPPPPPPPVSGDAPLQPSLVPPPPPEPAH